MIAKNKNSLPQALPLKQYGPRTCNEEAAQKFAESLEKLLPLLDEMKKAVEGMKAKVKEAGMRQQVAQLNGNQAEEISENG